MVMHTTLKEMPGPRAEMAAVVTRWDPVSHKLTVASCGHVPPVVVRADGTAEPLEARGGRGLGGRARPRPREDTMELSRGDRLILVSDGVAGGGQGKAGLGLDGVILAALRSPTGTAAETVRKVHTAVLESAGGGLKDDATAVCLSVG
jgi:phosphoserine phosphatase RsbU/P